jgi:uncharacterized protein YbjT (DUF2867 family)
LKVLVTGGTGVVGQAAVTELLRHGHLVRLFSRNAADDARQWSQGVEPWPASICDQAELSGCAEGCDLVLHVAGIMEESPPELTYETVNVEGTRNLVREAQRCRVGRFIYMSSLGAGEGKSPYHRSKRRAEEIVRNFSGGWIILRPGNVYGPGDEVVSLLFTIVRTMLMVPVIGTGDDKFQPIWVEDLAAAVSESVRRTDLHGRVLELAGEDVTTTNELLDKISQLTGRSPARLPIPSLLASASVAIADIFGAKQPVTESQLIMLREGNFIRTPGSNALTGVLRIKPTPLERGLRKLADAQPEQTPDTGVGSLKRKRFWVDMAGTGLTAEELFTRFRLRFSHVAPWLMNVRAEPETPTTLEKGATITMALPLRGNVQVRVEELTANQATLITLSGHPLAGAIRFISEQYSDVIRFQVQIYDRPANLADWLMMRTVGEGVQAYAWERLLEAVVRESAGTSASPVRHEEDYLDEKECERVEGWVKEIVIARKRAQASATTSPVKRRDGARQRGLEGEGLGENADGGTP